MKLPQIRMESQLATIRMEQTPPKMNMEQLPAEMTIKQRKADVKFQTSKGKLTIDQSQAWEEMNLMSTIRFNELHAKRGKQTAMDGTARRAEQGAELIKIENNVPVFAEQAIQNGHPQMKRPIITYIPSPFAVKFHYEKGQLDIDVQTNQPMIDVKINKPEISFQRGQTTIDMEQYAQLKIDFDYLYK